MEKKSEILSALEMFEKDKGIKKSDLLAMIEGALASALRKLSGKTSEVEVNIDPQTGDIRAYLLKKAVDQVSIPTLEISLEQARLVQPEVKLDEMVKIIMEVKDFSRIAAQTAKQVILQKMREVEKENLLNEFLTKEGMIVSGSVYSFLDRNLIVDLNKTEGLLPIREQIRKERFHIGDAIRCLVLKVERGSRGPTIILSRADSLFLQRLLESEIPEISEKIVEIKSIARDPGYRSKVAVVSHNPKVDPVGACLGTRGYRIQPVVEELSGERVEIISYHENPAEFVASALSPAKVSQVKILDETNKQMEVLVKTTELSLAIGREGQNVKLASKLTGWNLEVQSMDKTEKESGNKINHEEKSSPEGQSSRQSSQ